jgi:hypothetical protein
MPIEVIIKLAAPGILPAAIRNTQPGPFKNQFLRRAGKGYRTDEQMNTEQRNGEVGPAISFFFG